MAPNRGSVACVAEGTVIKFMWLCASLVFLYEQAWGETCPLANDTIIDCGSMRCCDHESGCCEERNKWLTPAIFLAIAVVMMVVFCTLLAAGWYWLCCRDSDKSKNKPRCLSCVQTEVAPDQLALQEEEASPGPSTQDQLALQEEEASPGPSTQDQLALQEAEASPGPSTQDQLALQEEEASPGPSTQDQLALQEEEASPGPSTQDQLALQEEEASPGPSTQDQQGQREADGLAESPQ
ncbi:hypothetical protein BaRGS_00022744 [Batillaria attramentaria]|uniref:Uncharacterized protein n=1 Tax=Batillaria attramentaria TaxID=370345 RepID=A0ABD0KGH7_9CAEN